MSIKIASRGDVWLVNFDPTLGSEINKKRPAAVVSSDALGILPLVVVVPLTDWKERYAKNLWHIKIANDGLDKTSAADALQIRSVSTQRLVKKLGSISPTAMEEIAAAIAAVIEYQ